MTKSTSAVSAAKKDVTATAKPAVKKEAKPVAKKKTAAKKPAAKKAVKTDLFVQFGGKEYQEKDILKMVKSIWTKEMKKKVSDMKDVQIFVKPEEYKAYYIINKEFSGEVAL